MQGLPNFYPIKVKVTWSNDCYEAHETASVHTETFDGSLDFAELNQLAPLLLALEQAGIHSGEFGDVFINIDIEDKKKNPQRWQDLIRQKWTARLYSKGDVDLRGTYGHGSTFKIEIVDFPLQAYATPDLNQLVIPALNQTIHFDTSCPLAKAEIQRTAKNHRRSIHNYRCIALPISKYQKLLKYQTVLADWHQDTQNLQSYIANAIA